MKQKFRWTYFLLILFASCKTTAYVSQIETTNYPLNKPGFTSVDSTVLNYYESYKRIVDSSMNKVLIVSEMSLDKKTPEGLLGNVCADIVLIETNKNYITADGKKVDFCFLNNGGLRAALPKGEITIGNIYSLMPFENEIVVLTLTGETTKKLLDFIAVKGGMPVSGITLRIKDTLAVNVFIQQKEFDISKTYKVSTSDYLANGGDNLTFLSEALTIEFPGIKLRDAIISNLIEQNTMGKTLTSKIEGRIKFEK
jgi:2',3'-cyclic-nucleotide 2'-phosphodiesterase (5'-nucleotidase family)